VPKTCSACTRHARRLRASTLSVAELNAWVRRCLNSQDPSRETCRAGTGGVALFAVQFARHGARSSSLSSRRASSSGEALGATHGTTKRTETGPRVLEITGGRARISVEMGAHITRSVTRSVSAGDLDHRPVERDRAACGITSVSSSCRSSSISAWASTRAET